MNANKLFSEFSLKKIWDKLLQHDKALNATMLVLSSGNWTENSDGTFTNTIPYSSFKETDNLSVELYNDGTLSETVVGEYCVCIKEFEIVNGALIATATIKPTQSMILVIKGEFEVDAVVGDVSQLVSRVDDCFQSVSNGKALVASAITDMEVQTDATATFEEMANNIRSIETGVDISDTTAVASQVTEGFIFYDKDGNRCEGTRPMPVGSKTGSFYVSRMNDGDNYVKDITFDTPFDTVPTVTANSNNNWRNGAGTLWTPSSVDKFYTSVSNVSRTGFTVTLQCRPHYNLYASEITCTWRATTG